MSCWLEFSGVSNPENSPLSEVGRLNFIHCSKIFQLQNTLFSSSIKIFLTDIGGFFSYSYLTNGVFNVNMRMIFFSLTLQWGLKVVLPSFKPVSVNEIGKVCIVINLFFPCVLSQKGDMTVILCSGIYTYKDKARSFSQQILNP